MDLVLETSYVPDLSTDRPRRHLDLYGREKRERLDRRDVCEGTSRQCHEWAGISGTIGRGRPELGIGIRSPPYKSDLVFFQYSGDRFEIVAIIEGHRDIDAHLIAGDDS